LRFVATSFLQLLIETLNFDFELWRSRRDLNPDLQFRCTSFLVVLPQGSHPFPSRTRKLSLAGPMILRWKRRGNVGHRQDLNSKGRNAQSVGGLFLFFQSFANPLLRDWRRRATLSWQANLHVKAKREFTLGNGDSSEPMEFLGVQRTAV
jgi:hypothetical protein